MSSYFGLDSYSCSIRHLNTAIYLGLVTLKKALIIPDVHRPFHDRKAYNIMLEAASYLLVDEIVLLGDYADFYAVSRYPKDPRVKVLLEEEVLSVNSGLDELDHLFPQAKKVYLEGNHEQRLEKYLIEKAPALFGVTQLDFLFELNKRPRWSYIPFGRDQKYQILGSELLAFHRPKGPQPKAHLQRTGVSSIYGDIHKIERGHQVNLDGKHLVSACPGWLGDVSSRVFDYMPSVPQWQLGFGLVYLDSSDFHIDLVEIKSNKAIVQGKLFTA